MTRVARRDSPPGLAGADAEIVATVSAANDTRDVPESRPYEEILHESFASMLREADAYFMKSGRLQETLRHLAETLDAEGIAYALVGGMALGELGYVRMTDDIDVVLNAGGLRRFTERCVGRGYVATHPGATRSFRDARTGVRIEVLVAGEFPGDGKPKAIAFPDPEGLPVGKDGLRVLELRKLLELKLASGMTAAHRLRDLADVQELIKALNLPADVADELDPSVREKFLELWNAVAGRRD